MLQDFVSHGLERLVGVHSFGVDPQLIIGGICNVRIHIAFQQLFDCHMLPARLRFKHLIVDPLLQRGSLGGIVLLACLEQLVRHATLHLAQSELLPAYLGDYSFQTRPKVPILRPLEAQ